jgi:hypothetical protein
MPKQAASTHASAHSPAKGPSTASTRAGREARVTGGAPGGAGGASSSAERRTVTSICAVYRHMSVVNSTASGAASEPALATAQGCEKRLMPSSALSTTAVAADTLSGPAGSLGSAPGAGEGAPGRPSSTSPLLAPAPLRTTPAGGALEEEGGAGGG